MTASMAYTYSPHIYARHPRLATLTTLHAMAHTSMADIPGSQMHGSHIHVPHEQLTHPWLSQTHGCLTSKRQPPDVHAMLGQHQTVHGPHTWLSTKHGSCLWLSHIHGIHQMYMRPRFSWSVASSIRRAAWPSQLRGSEGVDSTPSSVPDRRPSMTCSASLA
jgi:hypothetical protein